MKSDDQRKFIQLNEQLPHDIELRLVKTRNETGRIIEDFCTALQNAAPKIHVVQEKEDSDAPFELRIHPRICYRSVPLGHELGPFLKALLWCFDIHLSPPVPVLLKDLTLPVDLKLYISEHCPYCPAMVENLLPLALSSAWVRLTVIDAGLFSDDALKDYVQSVPTLIMDSRFRWTGTIHVREVVEAMIHRDPSRLEADTLISMISDGNAGLISRMMIEKNMIFPAMLDLLLHPKWPVRLGAMVAMETISGEKPDLARQIINPLWDRFNFVDDKVKGDILYLVGEIDDGASVGRIENILNRRSEFDVEIIEAAEEAFDKQKIFL